MVTVSLSVAKMTPFTNVPNKQSLLFLYSHVKHVVLRVIALKMNPITCPSNPTGTIFHCFSSLEQSTRQPSTEPVAKLWHLL